MDRITAAEVLSRLWIGEYDCRRRVTGDVQGNGDTLSGSDGAMGGARLLHRTTRKLSLTHAGEATLERCRRMLEFAQDMDLAEGRKVKSYAVCYVSVARNLLGRVLWLLQLLTIYAAIHRSLLIYR